NHAAGCGFGTHTWQLAWALTNFLDQQGHWPELAAVWTAGLGVADRLADPAPRAYAHRLLAFAYVRQGRVDDAGAHFRQALGLYREAGDLLGQAHVHRKLGLVYGPRGRYGDALDHSRQALDLYRAVGNRLGQARALNNVGWYRARLGDQEQALTCC